MPEVNTPVRRSRGRPSKEKAAFIDRCVLDAAWEVFLEMGYDQATMEQIAKRAGITKTPLYLRHNDKAALLRATVNDRMTRWSKQNPREGWLEGTSLEERLVNLAVSILGFADNPELLATSRLTHGTVGEAGRIARELDLFIREPTLQKVADEIAEYSKIDGYPVTDPMTISRFFIGMLESMIDRYAEDYNDPARHEALARQVVTVLFRGRSAW